MGSRVLATSDLSQGTQGCAINEYRESCRLRKVGYHVPVGAVKFLPGSSFLLVACGPLIRLYCAATPSELQSPLETLFAFDNTSGVIHGITARPAPLAKTTALCDPSWIVAIWGAKCFHVYLLSISLAQSSAQDEVAVQSPLQVTWTDVLPGASMSLSDWVLDMAITTSRTDGPTGYTEILAVLAHNTVQLWRVGTASETAKEQPRLVKSSRCQDQSTLFSARICGPGHATDTGVAVDECVVAVGTCFDEILLWRPFRCDAGIGQGGGEDRFDEHGRVKVECRAQTPKGGVYSIDVSSDNRLLCAASEDRTIRVFSLQFDLYATQPWACDEIFKAFAHESRVYSCHVTSRGAIVSAGEDGLVNIWEPIPCGQGWEGPVCTIPAHAVLGIWALHGDSEGRFIATGGNDGSVCIWNVALMVAAQSPCSRYQLNIPVNDPCSSQLTRKRYGDLVIVRAIACHGSLVLCAMGNGSIWGCDLDSTDDHGLEPWLIYQDPNAYLNLAHITVTNSSVLVAGGSIDNRREGQGPDSYIIMIPDLITQASQRTPIGDIALRWRCHPTKLRGLFVVSSKGSLDAVNTSTERVATTVPGILSVWSAGRGIPTPDAVDYALTSPSIAHSIVWVAERHVYIVGDTQGQVHIFSDECPVTQSPHPAKLVCPILASPRLKPLEVCVYNGTHKNMSKTSDATPLKLFTAAEGRVGLWHLDVTPGALHMSKLSDHDVKVTNAISLTPTSSGDSILYGVRERTFIGEMVLSRQSLPNINFDCGGIRRPFAFEQNGALDGSKSYLFASALNSTVSIIDCRTIESHGKESSPPNQFRWRVLQPRSHSELITCAVWLGLPDRGRPTFITGSDDNTLQLCALETHHRTVTPLSLLRGHTATVRSVTVVHLTNTSQLLFSAGTGGALFAWELNQDPSGQVSVTSRDHISLGADTTRVLRLEVVHLPGKLRVMVLACTAGAIVHALLYDWQVHKWFTLAQDTYHSYPILSSAIVHLSCTAEHLYPCSLLWTGSTDGIMRGINLTKLIGFCLTFVPDQQQMRYNSRCYPLSWGNVNPFVLVTEQRMQQSGINTLNVAPLPEAPDHYIVVSGGDDESIALHSFQLDQEMARYCPVGTWTYPGCHGAAITGVAIRRDLIISTGCDQRVNVWGLGAAGAQLNLRQSCLAEVTDITGVAIHSSTLIPESQAGARDHFEILVFGQGMCAIDIDLG